MVKSTSQNNHFLNAGRCSFLKDKHTSIFRGTSTGCRNRPTGTSRSLTSKSTKSCTWEQQSYVSVRAGVTLLESSLTEKHLGALAGTKLNMSQPRTLAAERANGNLGCIRLSIASRSRGMILPLCSALVKPYLECWVQFWPAQYKRWNNWRQTSQGPQTQVRD